MRDYFFYFFLFLSFNSFAQKENIHDFSNKLLCNAYVYGKTDPATFGFLKIHFPYLTKPKPQGIIFTPPIALNTKSSIVSMNFTKHPFFNFKIKSGHLDFLAKDDDGSIFETGAYLWLIFDNENDANITFTQLIDSFQNYSNHESIIKKNGQKIASFTGKANNYTYKPQLTLLKDSANNAYELLFKSEFDGN
jgi:hypothetical protein